MRTIYRTRKREPSVEFVLAGESTQEDPNEFYVTFCDSLEAFCKPKSFKRVRFTFSFKLECYNSTSAHHLTRILTILKPLVKRKLVVINWYYLINDQDLEEQGEELIQTMHVDMNMIKVKDL